MEIEKSFSLFGNIKTFLVGLITGSIVFSLLVPRIVNNLNGIFGFGFIVSYLIFVFIYFVLPFLAVAIWFKSKNYNGFNLILRIKRKRYLVFNDFYFSSIVILFCLFIFLGLIFTNLFIDWIFILGTLILIIYFLFQAVRLRFLNRFYLNKVIALDYEFLLLLILSLVAAIAFTYGQVTRNKKVLFKDSEYGSFKNILKRHKIYTDFKKVVIEEIPSINDSIGSLLTLLYLEKIPQGIQEENKLNKYIYFAKQKADSVFYKSITNNLHYHRGYLDSLYGVKSFLGDESGLNSLYNADKPVLRRSHFINLIKLETPKTKLGALAQPLNANSLKVQKSVIEGFESYLLLISNKWEEYMKDNWEVLLQKLQFKGLLWFFTLYFLSITALYFISFRLKILSDLEKDQIQGEALKKNKYVDNKTEAELHVLWLKKQLYQNTNLDNLDRMVRLSITGSVLKGFILNLVIFIAPFFRHIESEDINLEKPLLNYDLATVIGIKSLGSENKTNGGSNKPVRDSLNYIVINSFNYRLGRDSTRLRIDTMFVYLYKDSLSIDNILKEVKVLNGKADRMIGKLTDGDPEEAIRIIGNND